MPDFEAELARIQQAYSTMNVDADQRYARTRADVYLGIQERHRGMIKLLGNRPLHLQKLLEVGCGDGANLLELIQLGFSPENLTGNDLRPEVLQTAANRLASGVTLLEGDACALDMPAAELDMVLLSTVFSSILDLDLRAHLADCIWAWLKPGGAVLWYDFAVDNPNNQFVRGVSIQMLKKLFPHGHLQMRRVTLAPPIARRVTRWHPGLYTVFNSLPVLRTHRLCLITK